MIYVQIFSMTDHAAALQGRYEGPYQGNNAELQTTEVSGDTLRVSSKTKGHQTLIPNDYLNGAKVVLAYRHSDTGVLTGTSETLFSVKKTPWEDMPGFAILGADKNTVTIRMWDQEMSLKSNRIYRIHFGKTIVYLKNYGMVKNIEWTDEVLSEGPAQLHSADVDENITIAPPTGSGIQVKMGQETQN